METEPKRWDEGKSNKIERKQLEREMFKKRANI